jgi:hypothetical protein
VTIFPEEPAPWSEPRARLSQGSAPTRPHPALSVYTGAGALARPACMVTLFVVNTPARALPVHLNAALAAARAPNAVSPSRKRVALALAALSDLAQWFFFPATVEGAASPVELAIDGFTALVILLVVGFHWRLAIALLAELVPGVDMFPTWTAVVLSLPTAPPPPKALPPA